MGKFSVVTSVFSIPKRNGGLLFLLRMRMPGTADIEVPIGEIEDACELDRVLAASIFEACRGDKSMRSRAGYPWREARRDTKEDARYCFEGARVSLLTGDPSIAYLTELANLSGEFAEQLYRDAFLARMKRFSTGT